MNRTQHPTDANATSSRSHAVFQVTLDIVCVCVCCDNSTAIVCVYCYCGYYSVAMNALQDKCGNRQND